MEALTEASISQNLPIETVLQNWLMVGRLADKHPDLLAGNIVTFIHEQKWPVDTGIVPVKGESSGDSVLMAMRILIYRLRKHEGKGGKADDIYNMMTRLGYFSVADILR